MKSIFESYRHNKLIIVLMIILLLLNIEYVFENFNVNRVNNYIPLDDYISKQHFERLLKENNDQLSKNPKGFINKIMGGKS